MSKMAGFHDVLLRVPESLWEEFVAYHEKLRPRRSYNQQIVSFLEDFIDREKERRKEEWRRKRAEAGK